MQRNGRIRFFFAAFLMGVCSAAHAQIGPGDVVLALSQGEPNLTVEVISGPADEFAGELQLAFWDEVFLQAIEFDNLNGISHNPNGNLLSVNFGREEEGGSIFNLPTDESAGTADQLIGDTNGLGGTVERSRLGGLSVSPGNSKIAVTGYDTGRVIVYDYTAGDTLGAGASLAGARQSDPAIEFFSTQGTTWMDDNTLLVFDAAGSVVSVDSTTMNTSVVAELGVGEVRSRYTDIDYNPALSPYVYASHGSFTDGNTQNLIFLLDPNDGFSVVKTVDLSQSANTLREIGLAPIVEGDEVTGANLFLGQFSGLIDYVANVHDADGLTDDSSVDWYAPVTTASFSGLDVAVGVEISVNPGPDGDFNDDGVLDATDIDLLTAAVNTGGNEAEFDLNNDALVNGEDRRVWVEDLKKTYFGDANLDGEFSSTDLVTVFSRGQYEDGVDGNSNWSDGDWNGDTDFDTSDLVTAFSAGGYENGPRTATAAVPEPSSALLALFAALAIVSRRR